jgi:hypothetical protein
MLYDTWTSYDPNDARSPECEARLRKRLQRDREIVRSVLPRLRREIENPRRDMNSVYEALRPYYQETGEKVPMTPEDLPELEVLCRLVLERGGRQQNQIQTVLLRLIGSTAASESIPFLLEMVHYTRRGDHFGPERRQLAMWGLARVVIFHNGPEAYAALRKGLDDRNAEGRGTAADLILNAYLDARRKVPKDLVARLEQMARSDPDKDVRPAIERYLREPWTQNRIGDGEQND